MSVNIVLDKCHFHNIVLYVCCCFVFVGFVLLLLFAVFCLFLLCVFFVFFLGGGGVDFF